MAYEPTGNCLVNFALSGVRTNRATWVSEFLTTFFGSAAIELIFAFSWVPKDPELMQGWLQESLVSSGVCAAYVTLASTAIRIMQYEHRHEYEDEATQKNKPYYFYCSTVLTQMISGALAFGLGLGADAVLDYIISQHTLDNITTVTPALPIVGTCVIVGVKALSRFGIFKALDYVKSTCCNISQDETEIANLVEIENQQPSYTR